jgi:hypothetical protein
MDDGAYGDAATQITGNDADNINAPRCRQQGDTTTQTDAEDGQLRRQQTTMQTATPPHRRRAMTQTTTMHCDTDNEVTQQPARKELVDVKNVWYLRRSKKNTSVDNFYSSYSRFI